MNRDQIGSVLRRVRIALSFALLRGAHHSNGGVWRCARLASASHHRCKHRKSTMAVAALARGGGMALALKSGAPRAYRARINACLRRCAACAYRVSLIPHNATPCLCTRSASRSVSSHCAAAAGAQQHRAPLARCARARAYSSRHQ
jgi:hypothetical protein